MIRMKASFFSNMKISRKLVAVFLITSVIAMGVNIFIYFNLNQALDKINQVFSSNISLNELSDNLNQIHSGLTGYLETKGTDDLELYYASSQRMEVLMNDLNDTITNNSVKLSERDIRNMLETYLATADEAVQAKRGRNIDEYTAKYNECTRIRDYLNTYIYSVNNEQFRTNSNNYNALVSSLRYTEIMSMLIFAVASVPVAVSGFSVLFSSADFSFIISATESMNPYADAVSSSSSGEYDTKTLTSLLKSRISVSKA